MASLVGYVISGAVIGFTPLFGFAGSYHFTDPAHLPWFALIGVLGGLIGLLYAKSFYGIADLFARISCPHWVKPALGGVIVGLMALAIPEVLGTGYGWVQQGLGRQLLTLPLWIVLILPFARILARCRRDGLPNNPFTIAGNALYREGHSPKASHDRQAEDQNASQAGQARPQSPAL